MIQNEIRTAFEGVVEGRLEFSAWHEALQKQSTHPKLDNLRLVSKIRKIPFETMVDLPLLLCRAAFIRPQSLVETWDGLAASWQNGWTLPLPVLDLQPYAMPGPLWQLFWDHLEMPGIDKILEIGPRYVTYLDPWQRENYTQAMLDRTGVDRLLARDFQEISYSLEDLKRYPASSFGDAFYHHLVDNNLKLNLLDLTPYNWLSDRTGFISRRTLQTHDFWHVALGYGVTGGEELALEAVTLAQTSSPFPAYLLAMLVTRQLFFSPSQMPYILELLLKGWQHGRRTPPLLPLRWEDMWALPLEDLRQAHGIIPAGAADPVKS